MTAQVAVLSTQGIAVASDSAVTIVDRDHGNRSYPSADKIFSIPGVPVAVLHSGNAALRGVPWRLIVERWGLERDQAELATMRAYAEEFVAWLGSQQHFAGHEAQVDGFRWMYRDYLLSVRRVIREALADEGISLDPSNLTNDRAVAVVDGVVARYLAVLAEQPGLEGFEDAMAASWVAPLSAQFQEDFDWVFDDTPRTALFADRSLEIARLLVLKAEPFDLDAVLAFVGYGANAFFPSSWQGTISGFVADRPRVWEDVETQIGPEMRVSITPYGRTDAIQMLLRGASPRYLQTAHDVLDSLADELGAPQDDEGDQKVLAQAHNRLTERFEELEWTEFVEPIIAVAESLPLAELVRLADSLVGLASLRQLINGDASVGGPVDLARITKNGGFEWVRRKSDC